MEHPHYCRCDTCAPADETISERYARHRVSNWVAGFGHILAESKDNNRGQDWPEWVTADQREQVLDVLRLIAG